MSEEKVNEALAQLTIQNHGSVQTQGLEGERNLSRTIGNEYQIMATNDMPSLTKLTKEGIMAYEVSVLKMIGAGKRAQINRESCSRELAEFITIMWEREHNGDEDGWRSPNLTEEDFISFLKRNFIRNGIGLSQDLPLRRFSEELAKSKINITLNNYHQVCEKLAVLRSEWKKLPKEDISKEWEKEQVNLAMKVISYRNNPRATELFYMKMFAGLPKPQQFIDFTRKVIDFHADLTTWYQTLSDLNDGGLENWGEASLSSSTSSKKRSSESKEAGKQKKSRIIEIGSKEACWSCGRIHEGKACKLKDAAWANQEPDKWWSISSKGKEWKERGYDVCPFNENAHQSQAQPTLKKAGGEGEIYSLISPNDNFLVSVIIQESKERNIESKMLLDTGAKKNFISQNLVRKFENPVVRSASLRISTAFSNLIRYSNQEISLLVRFKNEFGEQKEFQSDFYIIESDIEIIVGRETIKQENLMSHFPTQIYSEDVVRATWLRFRSVSSLARPNLGVGDQKENLLALLDDESEEDIQKSTLMTIPNLEMKSAFEREDIQEIEDKYLQAIPPESLQMEEMTGELPIDYNGPESLQIKLKELVHQFRDRFRLTISEEPARVEPFSLRVNKELWERTENQSPPRKMTAVREVECRKQIGMLLEKGIIRESRSAYYSHVLMVPKANGKWRMCIDFKNLNLATDKEGWPIPNIQSMVERIGEKRPKFFIVLDLTSGYFQIPIEEESSEYTAFITPWGLYQWRRLPMGLKGAPAFFQRTLMTKVLSGIVSVFAELYLDDLNIFANTEEELIENFRKVLMRFREFNIYINPEKCKMGVSEVKYVGLTISSEGIHFARERLEDILKWPKPETMKKLKSFLGLANYFRRHVNRHSIIVQPLNRMLIAYDKSRRLNWTPEAENAFEEIKHAIYNCPRLSFVDDHSPIHLYTDASDGGIGAHLIQIVDDVERHIAFMSKAFREERMKNWDVSQKEGYAIYAALNEWDYLLRDRKFTLHTDHVNLTRLKDNYQRDKKVQRWLRCFQSYDFDMVTIKGEDNNIADAFSRLCIMNDVEEENANVNEDNMELAEEEEQINSIPRVRFRTIKKFHNELVGHHGYDRTMSMLKDNDYHWQNMGKHVKLFLARCPSCQKNNQRHSVAVCRPFTLSSSNPMQKYMWI